MSFDHGFHVGQAVLYEIAKKDGGSWQMLSRVIAVTEKRVTVEFEHWDDGRLVRRSARPYRLSVA